MKRWLLGCTFIGMLGLLCFAVSCASDLKPTSAQYTAIDEPLFTAHTALEDARASCRANNMGDALDYIDIAMKNIRRAQGALDGNY